MGSLTICCSQPSCIASTVTVLNPCLQDFGQIQKMVFWRASNTIASVTTALVEATWTTLLSATGDTKAIPTPFLGGVVIPASEPREFGGGNETRYGAPIRKGGGSVAVTANMYGEDQDVIAALKALRCEPLEVILINESGQFGYSDASTFSGFPIVANSLFVSDKGFGGMDDGDVNTMMFNLPPNWSDTFEISDVTTFALDMVNA